MAFKDCYGTKFYDSTRTICPYEECLLRERCRQIFLLAEGVIKSHRSRLKRRVRGEQIIAARRAATAKIRYRNIQKRGVPYKAHKSGYRRPPILQYEDDGSKRAKLLTLLVDELKDCEYKFHLTKFTASWLDDGTPVVKLDLRRKRKLVVYVEDELSDELDGEGFSFRGLYTNERKNYALNLMWVTDVNNREELRKLVEGFWRCYGNSE